LDTILERAMAKDRELRYSSASDIEHDLIALQSPAYAAASAVRESQPKLSDPYRVTAPQEVPPETGGAIGRRWKLMFAIVALLASSAAGYLYFHRAPKLTDKDTIILADFKNATGDPVFDETLRQGLTVQLRQSPFLSLISDERIQNTLGLMGRPADTRLSPELAREICERTGGAAVLEGSIASLGSQYVLGLRAKNCVTGDILDDQQAQAARKEDVLNVLSQIATEFRTRVGESLATVEKHNVPLAEATTASLEALKAYSTASRVAVSSGFLAAIPFLQWAVEIDPKFASAHADLGLKYSNIGESVLAAKSTTRAYQLRDRVSDRERFFITLTYDRQVTGNLERARQTAELWVQTYPREPVAHGLLAGFASQGTGKFEKSVEEAKIAISLDPDHTIEYLTLAFSYHCLDRLAEVESTIQRASERKLENPENPDFILLRYYVAFLKHDKAGMDRAATLAAGKPGAEDWMSHSQALVSARSGQLQLARRMSRDAVDLAQQAGQKERAALWETGAAMYEALFGNAAEASRSASAALALSRGRDVEYGAAFALALSGDFPQSRALADDLEKRFPEDTSVRFNYLPALRALFWLKNGGHQAAIEQLHTALPYEFAVPGISFSGFFGAVYPVYLRGDSYLATHQGAKAAAEFQKILDYRGLVLADPLGAMVRLKLGRAFALSGDTNKAKSAYQDFFALWKDADPDNPVLKQAKAEAEKLH
jgi:tetratricopeptide (TPR) repeat protein